MVAGAPGRAKSKGTVQQLAGIARPRNEQKDHSSRRDRCTGRPLGSDVAGDPIFPVHAGPGRRPVRRHFVDGRRSAKGSKSPLGLLQNPEFPNGLEISTNHAGSAECYLFKQVDSVVDFHHLKIRSGEDPPSSRPAGGSRSSFCSCRISSADVADRHDQMAGCIGCGLNRSRVDIEILGSAHCASVEWLWLAGRQTRVMKLAENSGPMISGCATTRRKSAQRRTLLAFGPLPAICRLRPKFTRQVRIQQRHAFGHVPEPFRRSG